jgi:hypothetical protein
MIKKIIILVVILTGIAVLIFEYDNLSRFFKGSLKNKENKEAVEKQNNTNQASALMSSLDFYSSSDVISLLSIKYSLSSDILIELISEYNKTQLDYDFDAINLSEIENKMGNEINKLNNNLNNIAKKYSIQPTTLVNIIIDYRLLKQK